MFKTGPAIRNLLDKINTIARKLQSNFITNANYLYWVKSQAYLHFEL